MKKMFIFMIVLAMISLVSAVHIIEYFHESIYANSENFSYHLSQIDHSYDWTLNATHQNGYLTFDGINDYIVVNDNNSLNNFSSFALSIWAYFESGASDNEGIFAKRGSGPFISFTKRVTLNKCKIRINNASSSFQIDSEEICYNDIWNYIVIDCNENTQRLLVYYSGSLYSNNSIVSCGINQNYNNVSIGAEFSTGSNFLEFSSDEIRFYNRSLNQNEISEINNSGRIANSSLPSNGLKLWYSFNELDGSTLYDKSGNGYNGI